MTFQLIYLHVNLKGVRLGEWNQSTTTDCEDGSCSDPVIDVPVAEVIPHENYQAYSRAQENDIALLRLERSITFTDWVKPICLPFSSNVANKNLDEQPLVVAGWGKVNSIMHF